MDEIIGSNHWSKEKNKQYEKAHFGNLIFDKRIRYITQKLLCSDDIESRALGMSMFFTYSPGNDELDDCSFRMYTPVFLPGEKREIDKVWSSVGKLKLHLHTLIQEIIDTIHPIWFHENYSLKEKFYRCSVYIHVLNYWMLYHPRIGSSVCSITSPIEYSHPELPFSSPDSSFGNYFKINECGDIYEWNWIDKRWDFPIKAEEYWKTHKKPINFD